MRIAVVPGRATRELRRVVLRPASAPHDPLPGDDRPDAVHLAALAGSRRSEPSERSDPSDRGGEPGAAAGWGVVVGACLVFPEPCPWQPERTAWLLRSMAVDPAFRGRGVGAAVLAAAERRVTDAGGELVWCHARETAVGFWRRAGYVGRYDDEDPRAVYVEGATGLPHRDMAHALT